MIKIGFCGAPGTGKTTVAQHFASALRFKTKKKVELIDEYARSFVSNFGETTIYDQYLISHHQIDKEISKNFCDYLITDSPAFLSLIYAYNNLDWKNLKQLHFLNELYNLLISNFHSYDYLFYLNFLNENLNDGMRIHNKTNEINDIEKSLKSFLILHKISFIELEGNLNERLDFCLNYTLKNDNNQESN